MKFYTQRSGDPRGHLNKILLVMRLFVFFLIAGIVQASAAGYGQQITLNKKNISIRELFRTVKTQSGYDVLWQNKQLNADRRLDASFNRASLDQVMLTILQGTDLSYDLDDKSIVIHRKVLSNVPVSSAVQDSVLYSGRVTDENNKPMSGATVRVKYSTRGFLTNNDGEFRVYAPSTGSPILQISYIGYGIKEISLKGNNSHRVLVQLLPATGNLSEVQVVSNGYQEIAKERATGSFEVVTAKQLEHSASSDLLKRLEGITTSMNFNNNSTFKTAIAGSSTSLTYKDRSPLADITIRGKNTLSVQPQNIQPFQNNGFPLLVIDGIPNAYGIDKIDPENVESVTLLKDAAAASIYGSRAANGVIVVKTKRGNFSQIPSISFSSSFNLTDKPDLFYTKRMSVSDYIDAESLYFLKAGLNYSDPDITVAQNAISPVKEIMNNYINRHIITEAEANAQIDALRGNDIRNDVTKYLIRNAFNQNYTLGVSGGSKTMAYRLSTSYSDSKNNTVNSGAKRIVLAYNASLKPLPHLELSWNANYVIERTRSQAPNTLLGAGYLQFNPYDRLADANGNPLALYKNYRSLFKNALSDAYGSKISDLTYKPLEEMNLGFYNTRSGGFNLGLNAQYAIDPSFSINLIYSYNKQLKNEKEFYSRDSYYVRELTTRFTDPITLVSALPEGDLLYPTTSSYTSQTYRGQLNYNHIWNKKHEFTAIAGIDVSQNYYESSTTTYFGYDPAKLTYSNTLNLGGDYPLLYTVDQPRQRLPYLDGITGNLNRAIGSYVNAAYTYNHRYTLSGSVRRDGSNVFGVTENQTGTPFYSAGLSWNIVNESFYNLGWLPRAQLRSTFGYNGNSNPITAPRPRINYNNTVGPNDLAYADVPSSGEATNNQLRPERTGQLNFGFDFGLRGGWLTGSFEYYIKNTKDLITDNLLDPSTGFSSLPLNTGDLRATGTDITLTSQNFQSGKLRWSTNLFWSTNRVKVKKLFVPGNVTAGGLINGSGTVAYTVGYDLQRLFAYPWAGLDPTSGDPRIFVNGQAVTVTSRNSSSIINGDRSGAKFIGSSIPIYFGALRNNFSYGSFTLSANILYKFKYFIRRPRTDLAYYSSLYNPFPRLIGAEFANRWRKPGDELLTNVPSIIGLGSSVKDLIYSLSDINTLKGDHIRLQEINLSWDLNKKIWGLKNIRVAMNVTNLGIIWRANKLGIDPDINDLPNPRSYSFQLSTNF